MASPPWWQGRDETTGEGGVSPTTPDVPAVLARHGIAPTAAQAVALLARPAAHLRETRRTGPAVARRRVWP